MGILSRLVQPKASNSTGNQAALTATGKHALSSETMLTATTPNAINPMNPGNWSTLRSRGIETQPRYMTKTESAQIRTQAKHLCAQVTPTVAALRALGRIEQADAKVTKAFRRYQGEVADGELTKIKANAKLGRHLHGQRAQYARAGATLYAAEQRGDQRVLEVQQDIARYFA